MRYLGVDYVGWFACSGTFNDSTKLFSDKVHLPAGKLLGSLYFRLYRGKKMRNFAVQLAIKLCSTLQFRKFAKIALSKEADKIIVCGYGADTHLWHDPSYLFQEKFKGKILITDRIWAYLNAPKYHSQFEYPALVFLSTNKHGIIAYLKSKESIEIISEKVPTSKEDYDGLGTLITNTWVQELSEEVSWPGQPSRTRKNVYTLYAERGRRGKVVVDMVQELKESPEPFAERVFTEKFPQKMNTLKSGYTSLEAYKDDWVASQQQMLRDFLLVVQGRESGQKGIKTFAIAGGISKNPALSSCQGWIRVPDILAGEESGGNALAYLGYCIEKEGLVVQHDRWEDGRKA